MARISLHIEADNPEDFKAALRAIVTNDAQAVVIQGIDPAKAIYDAVVNKADDEAREALQASRKRTPKTKTEAPGEPEPSTRTTAPPAAEPAGSTPNQRSDPAPATEPPTTTSEPLESDEAGAITYETIRKRFGELGRYSNKAVLQVVRSFNVETATAIPAERWPELLKAIDEAIEQQRKANG